MRRHLDAVRERNRAEEARKKSERDLANSQILLAEAAWREGNDRIARENPLLVTGGLSR